VKRLYENGNVAELTKLFLPRIAFGTAGLRSRMAPGYANMNELVIIQTTQVWLLRPHYDYDYDYDYDDMIR
jgi:phosphomannomutase